MKCLYDHYLANKAYFSAIIVKKIIYESFTHKMATKASWHRNYVTVRSFSHKNSQQSSAAEGGPRNAMRHHSLLCCKQT